MSGQSENQGLGLDENFELDELDTGDNPALLADEGEPQFDVGKMEFDNTNGFDFIDEDKKEDSSDLFDIPDAPTDDKPADAEDVAKDAMDVDQPEAELATDNDVNVKPDPEDSAAKQDDVVDSLTTEEVIGPDVPSTTTTKEATSADGTAPQELEDAKPAETSEIAEPKDEQLKNLDDLTKPEDESTTKPVDDSTDKAEPSKLTESKEKENAKLTEPTTAKDTAEPSEPAAILTNDDKLKLEGAPQVKDEDELFPKEPKKKGRKRIVDDDEEDYVEPEEDDESDDADDEPVAPTDPRLLVTQTHTIIIPSYALWFLMKKIHAIEKETLPEFFEGSHPLKSPKIYINYRNFMVNAYRLNPNEYLTLTLCRRNLVGDVGTLMRVHRFLTRWGIINYQVQPQLKPGFVDQKGSQQVGLPYAGDYVVKYDAPRGLFPFDTIKVNPDRIDVAHVKKLMEKEGLIKETSNANSETESKEDDAFGDLMNLLGASSKRNSPEAEEKTNGSVDAPARKRRRVVEWSDAETDKLVKAIKEHPSDWYKVSEIVGKSPQECVLQFLQIPIDDLFNDFSSLPQGDRVAQLLKYAPNFPVLSVDNPVVLMLAYVSQLVDPEVAKAASNGGKEAINKILEEKANSDLDGVKKESSPVQDAVATTLGVIGARLHLFATYEEREMSKHATTIVNHELARIEAKLKKLDELQTIYERERRNLVRQQEEVFIDRLALAKLTVGVTKKLEEAITLLEAKDTAGDVLSLLNEAKQLLYKPHKQSLTTLKDGESALTPASDADPSGAPSVKPEEEEDKMKPLSIKAPQTFQVWAP